VKRKRAKTIKSLRTLSWNLLSQIIRRTGNDHADNGICFTCDQVMHWKELQAGHGIGGRHNAVLFDEEIIRKQCPICNVFRRGNYQIFVTKLIKENGMEWWEKKLTDSRKIVTFKRSDYEERIESYRERLAALETHYTDVPFGGTT
jgi:hypothetical protein